MEDRALSQSTKKNNSHIIYLDSHLVTFWPNSTQQIPLSYSQELQSIHATANFEKADIL